MGKTTETAGDLLTGFTADLDDATLLAQFADPLAGPAAILGNATTRFLYDLGAYQRTATQAQPSPPATYTLARETHVSDLAAPRPTPALRRPRTTSTSFAYFDGFGREIQHKAQAAPGPVTDGGPPVSPRWAGSGWTIFDNKGRPVRQYEPFFSATNGFEFAAATGVSTVLFYDPPGRVVATLHPDSSWAKGGLRPLGRSSSGTATTPCWWPIRAPTPTWATTSIGCSAPARSRPGTSSASPARTARRPRTGPPGRTPRRRPPPTQPRPRSATATRPGGPAWRSPTTAAGPGTRRRTAYDTQGQPLAVSDPLGRRTQEYVYRAPQPDGGVQYLAGSDLAGQALYQINADGGARRGLMNVAGQPIRSWDARGHAFRLVYDPAQRPTHRYVSTAGAAEILIDLSVYGEGQPAANLCGRLFRHYDMSGYAENSRYDYAGNPISSVRQLAADYHQAVDWTPLAGLTAAAELDAAATAAGLMPTGDGGRDPFTEAAPRSTHSTGPSSSSRRTARR